MIAIKAFYELTLNDLKSSIDRALIVTAIEAFWNFFFFFWISNNLLKKAQRGATLVHRKYTRERLKGARKEIQKIREGNHSRG
jgi:hypothetical protein